jgi:hypothetical protein
MKIQNSLVILATIIASIFYAKPLLAECINTDSMSVSLTSDTISVNARMLKTGGYFPIYANQPVVMGCTVTGKMMLNYTIPDDSPISSVDLQMYVNGRRLNPRRMGRGSSVTFRFSPDKVQDYRVELKNLQSNTGAGNIYILDLEFDPWLNTP